MSFYGFLGVNIAASTMVMTVMAVVADFGPLAGENYGRTMLVIVLLAVLVGLTYKLETLVQERKNHD